MMTIPRRFRTNIEETFGEEGKLWLENLPGLLEEICKAWQLTTCKPVENLSFNYVCYADSMRYGAVVLKMGVKSHEIENEFQSLQYLQALPLCRCLDHDRSRKAILLERITPGTDLFCLDSPEDQINTGATLLKERGETGDLPEGFPYYGDWLKKSFQKVREKRAGGATVDSLFKKAKTYWNEQEALFSATVNHGDFHHTNILLDGNNQWKVIDPKGVLGFMTIECGRFILNQLERTDNGMKKKRLFQMSRTFSEKLNISPEAILKGSYIDQMLSFSWTLEGHIGRKKEQMIIEKMKAADRLYNSLLHLPQGMVK